MPSRTARRDAPLSYEDSKRLARHADHAVRVDLGARQDLRPEILYFLAADPAPEVRRAVALNPTTPRQADPMLARDGDEEVRGRLAAKLARLTIGLSRNEREQAEDFVVETLEVLARDQAVRVRQVLAETLKDVADAPPSVIQRLARDVDELVASPILEFSPLLSDADLLEIIRAGCATGRLCAISRRKGLGADIADAIVDREDSAAVTALLANTTAQIREETLDALVERAAAVTEWHEPLVHRPRLSSRAALELASFVAANLLQQLQSRQDLDAETARKVAEELERRLRVETPEPEDAAEAAVDDLNPEDAAFLRAFDAGDRDEVSARLTERSQLGPEVIERVLSSGSAKAITALAWKAGLDMRMAIQLQLRIGGIPPRKLLQARDGIDFPLSVEEMTWQIEFFESLSP